MRGGGQFLAGLLSALVFAGLLAGSLFLALAEKGLIGASVPGPAETELVYEILYEETESLNNPNATPVVKTRIVTATGAVMTPTPACPPVTGWITYEVRAGDTLADLAARHGISEAELKQANCLSLTTPILLPGMTLNLPKIPDTPTAPSPAETSTPAATHRSPTKPAVACNPPAGWVTYIVRTGDTLYGLSLAVGSTVPAIQTANCMGSNTLIRVGDRILLPRYPVYTAVPTWTRPPIVLPSFTPPPTFMPPSTYTPVTPPTVTWTLPPPPTNTSPAPPTNTPPPPPTNTAPPLPTNTAPPPPTNTSPPLPPTNTDAPPPLPTDTTGAT